MHRYGGLGNQRYPIGFSGDVMSSWASLAFQVRVRVRVRVRVSTNPNPNPNQLWLQLGALGRALHARRAIVHAWAAWVARRRRRPPLAAHVAAHLAALRAVACLRAGGVMRGWRKLRAAGRQWARLRRAARAALFRHELRALRTWAAEAAARRLRRHVLTVWLGGVRPEHLGLGLGLGLWLGLGIGCRRHMSSPSGWAG